LKDFLSLSVILEFLLNAFDFYIWNRIPFLLIIKKKMFFFFAFKCYFTVCLLKWHNGLLFVGSLNAVSILFVFQVG